MPFSKLFRSRWSALLWAGGVIWMAVDVSGAMSAPKQDGDDAAVANQIALFDEIANG